MTSDEIEQASQDGVQAVHLRLCPDSPIAILRFREIHGAVDAADDEAVVTTQYRYAFVADLQATVKLTK